MVCNDTPVIERKVQMNNTQLDLVKTATGVVATIGAGRVVHGFLQMYTATPGGTLTKVLYGVGTYAITGAVANRASESAVDTVDKIHRAFKTNNFKIILL